MFHLKLIFSASLAMFFIQCDNGTKKIERGKYFIEKDEVLSYANNLLIKRDTSRIKFSYVDSTHIMQLNQSLFSDKDQIKYNLLQYSYYVQMWDEKNFKKSIHRLMESELLNKDSCQSFYQFLSALAIEYHNNIKSDPIGYGNTMNSLINLPKEEVINCSDFNETESTFNITIEDN